MNDDPPALPDFGAGRQRPGRSYATRGISPGARAVLLAPLALLLGITLWVAAARPQLVGDTHGLVLNSERIVYCLSHGQFTFCDRRPDGRIGGRVGSVYRPGSVGPFPLMQYLLAVPLRALDVGAGATLRLLILVDVAALLATVALVWRTVVRLGIDVWGPVLTLALVISPLLWYATASFGEVLAGALLVAVVVAVVGGWRPVALVATVALACVSKETTPPFVVAMVLLAASARPAPSEGADTRRSPVVFPVAIGVTLGVLLNSLFNLLRYGTIWNRTYLGLTSTQMRTTRLTSNLVALAVRRDGGLLWFWPAAVGVIAFGLVAVLLLPSRAGWRRVLAAGPAAVLAANQVGLAAWTSPFGWVAWGPRLSLPMIPPLLLLTAVLLGRRGAWLMGRFLRTGWIWLLGVTLTIGGLPQLAFLRAGPVLQRFFHPHATCPTTPAGTHLSRTEFCHRVVTGARIPVLLDGIHTLGSPLGVIAGLAMAGTVAGLLATARATPLAIEAFAAGGGTAM